MRLEDLLGREVTKPKFNELPTKEQGDILTLKEFVEDAKNHSLIDYDGHGYLATAEKESNIVVYPSMVLYSLGWMPDWVTHITWYNK